jgi:hypothetical protein
VRIYSGGDSNVTSDAAAALLQNDTAMISFANRVIGVGYITLSLPCGEQKGRIRRREGLHEYRRKAQQELLSNSIKASSARASEEDAQNIAAIQNGFDRITLGEALLFSLSLANVARAGNLSAAAKATHDICRFPRQLAL